MKGKEVFTTRRTFDLEKAIPLAEVREEFDLSDFEAYFTVIETAEGKQKVVGYVYFMDILLVCIEI